MRTIVLLGVVVGLLVVGKAHAECAWVLWDGTVGFANNGPPTDTAWTATAAFPTSARAKRIVTKPCTRLLWRDKACWGAWPDRRT